jgi:benzoyl-CoA reductase/2-hydroxyglutaryl-CoA dehydratase subunit BcrC/BadD/HgdB
VAAARLDEFNGKLPAAALVLTTTCDQIRYAAALLQHWDSLPVFLMHVPRTWQDAAVRAFYGEELARLGRFLVACGGTAPTDEVLCETVLRYDRARAALRLPRCEMRAGAYALAIAAVRGSSTDRKGEGMLPFSLSPFLPFSPSSLPLALVGGPMSRGDYELLKAVEDAGGRFVLDATEAGERTLPAVVDLPRLQANPRDELARIYFDCIPDVFQRPNDRLFAWLRAEVARRGVRGILVRRYVWCDHWHGELPRLRDELAVPLLDWDGSGNDPRSRAGAVGRMEAFLEMLR